MPLKVQMNKGYRDRSAHVYLTPAVAAEGTILSHKHTNYNILILFVLTLIPL